MAARKENKHFTLTQLVDLGQDAVDVLAAMRDDKITVGEGIAGMYAFVGMPVPSQAVTPIHKGHVSPKQEADFSTVTAILREKVRLGEIPFLDARNAMRRLAKKPPLSAAAKPTGS